MAGDHIGATFSTAAGFVARTVALARRGLAANGRVVVFPAHRDAAVVDRLLEEPADLRQARRDGRLDLADPDQVQRGPGVFDPDYLTETYAAVTAQTVAAGFTGLWVSVDMTWAEPSFADPAALASFEARSFPLFATRQLTAVCQYDLSVFPKGQAVRACQAHPCNDGLRLRHDTMHSGTSVRLSGQTDLSNAGAWQAMLRSLQPDSGLDITAMAFIDVPGLREIARAVSRHPGIVVWVTSEQAEMLELVLDRGAANIHIAT
jgi:hypothetical protein